MSKTKTTQSFTLEGTDVEITKLIEYMADYWLDFFAKSMYISDAKYDMGHYVLSFSTQCETDDISSHVLEISKMFPAVFFMYMYRKNDSLDGQAMCHYMIDGKISISENVNILEVFDE